MNQPDQKKTVLLVDDAPANIQVVNAILKDKDTEDKLEAIGFMPVGGSVKEAGSYVQDETKRWGDIIRRVGLEAK